MATSSFCAKAASYTRHFEITSWEEPNEDDRRVFPIVRRVYIVEHSFLYASPVALSAIDVTRIRFGKEISEDKFQEILKLAEPTT